MFRTDLDQLVRASLLVVGAVLPVVNPLGDAPLFLAMTQKADEVTRGGLARRVATYSFGLLLGSMLIGSFILRFFDLSVPIVQLAGGALVSALGWKLLNQDETSAPAVDSVPTHPPPDVLDRALYPLTLPLTVDPGSIAVAITVGINHAHDVRSVVMHLVAAVLSCAVIALSIFLTYRYAWHLSTWLGGRWMSIVVRLSAFIVLCIGVQIMWNGAKALVPELASYG